jgi:hypothetical protein
MQDLRANTAAVVVLGPFVDAADGFSPETGLSLLSVDHAALLKHDGTLIVDISGASWGAVASMDGYYTLSLTASHTDTEGRLTVTIRDDSLCRPVKKDFMVLSEAAYDSKYEAKDTGYMQVEASGSSSSPQLLQTTTIATLASQTEFTLTAGSADDDAYNGAIAIVTDQSTSTQKAVGTVSDYTGSTKTVTLASDPGIFTMAVGDTIDIIAAVVGSGASAVEVRQEMDNNSTQLALIVADTDEMQQDLENGGRLDLIFDELTAQGDTNETKLDTAQADLDIITGADGANLLSATQASIDAIEADTDEMQGDLEDGGRLDLLIDAIKVITDALGATAAARLALSAGQIIPFTVDTVINTHTPTTTEFQADDITETTNDHYNDRIIVWTSGVLTGQATSISDYAAVGGIGQFTVTAMTDAPSNNDTGIIL